MDTIRRGGGAFSRLARKALALSAVLLCAAAAGAVVSPALAADLEWPFLRGMVAAVDHPLRPLSPVPAFSTVPGPYEVVWAARGMVASSGSARLVLRLPGPPLGAALYLSGRDDPRPPDFPGGDAIVRVAITNGAGVTRVVQVVPVVYQTGMHSVNRLDITRFLAAGTNTLAITGYDLNIPEGAFAYAVCTSPTAPDSLIQIADGLDVGYFAAPPPYGPDSEAVGFVFEPSAAERRGRVVLAIAGAEPGRGDEIFGIVGSGTPEDFLPDTDGDGLPDIVSRRAPLLLVDGPPLGVDRANATGALEALRSALSLEEDCLGVPRGSGGCGVGPELNVLAKPYDIGVGRTFSAFQVQSEDPEDGDSFTVIAAINELPAIGLNPFPEIDVVKDVTPAQMPEPGGMAAFTVTVGNLGPERLRLLSLVDDVFGDLDGRGTCVTPVVITVGGTYTCTFDAVVNGTVENPHEDTVTASGVGVISGIRVSDADPALVTFTRPQTASLGDRVWLDADRDGVQDPGEPGIDGVSVVLKDGLGNIIASTTTSTVGGVVGYYLFANLPAGSYTVEVIPPAGLVQTYDLDGLGTPDAAGRTLAAGAAATDVDFGYAPSPNPDFILTKTASIDEGYPGDLVTYVFTVTNIGNVRLVNVTVVDDVLGPIGAVTLDPGQSGTLTYVDYALPVCSTGGLTAATLCDGTTIIEDRCSLPNTATATWGDLIRRASDCVNILPFGSIGDYVWEDLDRDGVQDPGEPPIAGVTLTLYLDGVPIGTAVTDAGGAYLFTGLKAGDYTVDSGGKAGYALTTANDPMDVLLGVGQDYLDADFGYFRPAPAITVTKVADPTFGYLYAADPTTPWPFQLVATPLGVTYTVAVTNPGLEPLLNVTVTDDPSTLVFVYVSGDTNGDGALDLTETWIFTATWTYDTPGTYPDTVTARGTGAVTGTDVSATDDAVVEAVGCGQCLGKVSTLTLRYNGSAAAIVTVIVENANFADPVAFTGSVEPGGTFSFGPLSSPNGGFDGTLGTQIVVLIDGVADTYIHTSCSQPIYPGQDWGSFTVLTGASKQGGLLCPIVAE